MVEIGDILLEDQHDGTPPHDMVQFRQIFNESLPHDGWRCAIANLLARSPDIKPLDFFI